jgi:hypothetical protein
MSTRISPFCSVPTLVVTVAVWLSAASACAPFPEAAPAPSAPVPSSGPSAPAGTAAPPASVATDPCDRLVRGLAALTAAAEGPRPDAAPMSTGPGGTAAPSGPATASSTVPPEVPAGIAGAARRWADALRAEASGAAGSASPPAADGAPVVDADDAAVVEDAVGAACGPAP